jgi:biotin carboxyl carrier protein
VSNYKVQVNGKAYEVRVEQTGKRKFQVSINNEIFECHSFRSDEIISWSLHRGEKTLHARARSLHFDRVDVWLAGTPFQAFVHSSTSGHFRLIDSTGQRTSSGEIRAAMPGRITSVLVKLHEQVDAGTPLLILESMKMQNEIVSPRAGRIKSIRVVDGATVRKDSVLIEIA